MALGARWVPPGVSQKSAPPLSLLVFGLSAPLCFTSIPNEFSDSNEYCIRLSSQIRLPPPRPFLSLSPDTGTAPLASRGAPHSYESLEVRRTFDRGPIGVSFSSFVDVAVDRRVLELSSTIPGGLPADASVRAPARRAARPPPA